MLKVDGQTQCVTGALADQVSEGQAWPARQLDAEQLSNWYNMRVAGQSRIANRAADVLVLEPKDTSIATASNCTWIGRPVCR